MASAIGQTAEGDILKLLFQNTNWANVGDATGVRGSSTAGSFYISLSTGVWAAANTQATNEAVYTNYTREAVARSSGGWTVTGSSPTTSENAGAITFPTCGVTGETEKSAVIGRDSGSSAGETIFGGDLSANLAVANGITPSFAINALAATLL